MTDKVNSDVRETVDSIDYITQWAMTLWDDASLEFKAFVLSVFVISILMQWVKKTFLAKKPKRERVSLLWASSLPLGLSLAGIGYVISDGVIHLGYWLVIGLTSGSTAMGVHFISIKIVWPAVQIIGGAIWARVMLMIRGVPKDA